MQLPKMEIAPKTGFPGVGDFSMAYMDPWDHALLFCSTLKDIHCRKENGRIVRFCPITRIPK